MDELKLGMAHLSYWQSLVEKDIYTVRSENITLNGLNGGPMATAHLADGLELSNKWVLMSPKNAIRGARWSSIL